MHTLQILFCGVVFGLLLFCFGFFFWFFFRVFILLLFLYKTTWWFEIYLFNIIGIFVGPIGICEEWLFDSWLYISILPKDLHVPLTSRRLTNIPSARHMPATQARINLCKCAYLPSPLLLIYACFIRVFIGSRINLYQCRWFKFT